MSILYSDSDIVDIINNNIVPNLQGENLAMTTLTDITDIGKAMSTISATSFKDYTNTFATKLIQTMWNNASVELLKLPIFKTSLEYGAILQSIYRKGVTNAEESSAFKLINGQEYDIETYHGWEFDVKIFDEDVSFRLVYSIPNTMYESAFTYDGIRKLSAYLNECVDNDMKEKVNGLMLSTYQRLIYEHRTNRVKLVTMYNDYLDLDDGEDEWTLALLRQDEKEYRKFLAFAKGVIVNTRRGMIARSKKYNDGTVLASTPLDRNNLVLLGQFDEDVNNFAYASTFNWDFIGMPEHSIIDFWEGSGTGITPNFNDVSKVNVKVGNTTFSQDLIVGIAYDDRSCGVMVAPNKITTSYNGNGDFVTYYDYYTSRHMVDTRANAVVFTLE